VMPFPSRLHKVLERSDLTAVIDWMPHGRAFIVKQPNLLTTLVLSRFFKQTKYLSFTRQLNLWGFKRITRGIDSGSYYHERFLPGRPHLTMGMKRVKIKGTARIRPNPKGEPNFYYDYPPVYRGVVRPHKVGLATPLPANQRSTCVSAVGSFQPHTSAGMGHDMEARNSLAMGAAQFGLLHATGSSSGLTLSPEVRAALAAADTSRLCGSSLLRKDPARARPIAHHPPLSAAAAVEYRLQETVLGSMSNHARTTNMNSYFCSSSLPSACVNDKIMARLTTDPIRHELLGRESFTLQRAAVNSFNHQHSQTSVSAPTPNLSSLMSGQYNMSMPASIYRASPMNSMFSTASRGRELNVPMFANTARDARRIEDVVRLQWLEAEIKRRVAEGNQDSMTMHKNGHRS